MADSKVSDLTAATAALGADEIPVNEAGTSKKVTVTQIQTFITNASLGIIEASRQGMNLP